MPPCKIRTEFYDQCGHVVTSRVCNNPSRPRQYDPITNPNDLASCVGRCSIILQPEPVIVWTRDCEWCRNFPRWPLATAVRSDPGTHDVPRSILQQRRRYFVSRDRERRIREGRRDYHEADDEAGWRVNQEPTWRWNQERRRYEDQGPNHVAERLRTREEISRRLYRRERDEDQRYVNEVRDIIGEVDSRWRQVEVEQRQVEEGRRWRLTDEASNRRNTTLFGRPETRYESPGDENELRELEEAIQISFEEANQRFIEGPRQVEREPPRPARRAAGLDLRQNTNVQSHWLRQTIRGPRLSSASSEDVDRQRPSNARASVDHSALLQPIQTPTGIFGDVHDCGVCQDSLLTGGPAVKLPCHHIFHEFCIKRWLMDESQNTCPICRRDYRSELEQLRS